MTNEHLENKVSIIVQRYNSRKELFNKVKVSIASFNQNEYFGIKIEDTTETEIVFSFLDKKFCLSFTLTKYAIDNAPYGQLTLSLINGKDIDDTKISDVVFDEYGKIKFSEDGGSIGEVENSQIILLMMLDKYIDKYVLHPKGVDIATLVNY